MTSNTHDLTQGGILKKLLYVAVPIMGTQLMQMAYNLTDMFWLGHMKESVIAVAASGLAGMFLWLGMALMMIGRMGSEIGTSQNLGRGETDAAQGYAQDSTRIALILGTLYGLVLITMAGPLVSFFHVNEPVLFENACAYLRIVGIGIPLTYVSSAITGAFNGAGKSRISFWANAVGLAVNMVLDPLMILGWGWGVSGAAIATVIAQGHRLRAVCLVCKAQSAQTVRALSRLWAHGARAGSADPVLEHACRRGKRRVYGACHGGYQNGLLRVRRNRRGRTARGQPD